MVMATEAKTVRSRSPKPGGNAKDVAGGCPEVMGTTAESAVNASIQTIHQSNGLAKAVKRGTAVGLETTTSSSTNADGPQHQSAQALHGRVNTHDPAV